MERTNVFVADVDVGRRTRKVPIGRDDRTFSTVSLRKINADGRCSSWSWSWSWSIYLFYLVTFSWSQGKSSSVRFVFEANDDGRETKLCKTIDGGRWIEMIEFWILFRSSLNDESVSSWFSLDFRDPNSVFFCWFGGCPVNVRRIVSNIVWKCARRRRISRTNNWRERVKREKRNVLMQWKRQRKTEKRRDERWLG